MLFTACMAGGDLVARVGVWVRAATWRDWAKARSSWWLPATCTKKPRLGGCGCKQAAKRGATLIVVNPRPTRLDRYASHMLRYAYGEEAACINALIPCKPRRVPARRCKIIAGRKSDHSLRQRRAGLGAVQQQLAQACADLLVQHRSCRQAQQRPDRRLAKRQHPGRLGDGFPPSR